MMGLSLVPRIIAIAVCPVCDSNMQLETDSYGYMVINSKSSPEAKLLSLVAACCCPLCGNQLPGVGQTSDAVIARYIEHIQKHR